jgi:hypothetical protein
MAPKGDLVVDLIGLSDYAGQLDSIKQRMTDTGRVDRVLGDAGLAHPAARGALDDFMTGWRDGRKEIEEGLSSVAGMARKVIEEIAKRDSDLANDLRNHIGDVKT